MEAVVVRTAECVQRQKRKKADEIAFDSKEATGLARAITILALRR